MPYRYTVTLRGHRDPETGIVHFRCHTKLPLWGKYWMSGYVTDCKFVAKYHTDDHVGYFVMRRHR